MTGQADWKARAEAIIADERDYATRDFELAGIRGLELVNERLDAEGLRHKVWAAAPYACDRCKLVEWYECEVGVEGPQSWRDDSTFIASPFTAGRCSECNATMTHVMHRDLTFHPREPGRKIDAHAAWLLLNMGCRGSDPGNTWPTKIFRVPREPVRYTTHGVDDDGNVIYQTATHAFLAIDMSAIRRATEVRR